MGYRFESCSEHFWESEVIRLTYWAHDPNILGSNPGFPIYGEYSLIGRASVCGSGECGFNSHYSPFHMNLHNILLLSITIFFIGIWGVLINRRNIIILLMSFEIMYLAANLNFAFYSFFFNDIMGIVCILYAITIVGAESCVGLSIISVYYSIHKDVSLNTMYVLRR
jgi:NADH-quinone oxidoreductase subunit K